MNSRSGRSRVTTLLSAAMLVLLGTACTPESSNPPPESALEPHYAPVPRDLCARLRLESLVDAFDLNLPQSYEPSDLYQEDDEHSRVSCVFSTGSDSERFAIGGVRYEPTGSFVVSIYHDQAGAAGAYRQGVNGLEYREDARNGAGAPADGWWDEGEYSVAVEEVLEGMTIYDLETGDASNTFVGYVLRHENLYLQAQLAATAATRELDEATEVLHNLIIAVIDEIASHLTLAGE